MATSFSMPIIGNRYRHAAASGDLLDRRLDVVGRVVAPVHDQQILDAADDEQLALGKEAQISCSQPGPFGRASRRDRQALRQKYAHGLFGLSPIAIGDVVAVHPDLTDRSRRTLGVGLGIGDAHHR